MFLHSPVRRTEKRAPQRPILVTQTLKGSDEIDERAA
jgi:hypothetical protein